MTLPKVTIVTVTYNLMDNGRKDVFLKCLESVHNQSYPNIEHLIIDGGSKDGTLEMIQSFQQKGWVSYISEKDNGIYDAMNKGLNKAQGKYILFLNSDDLLHDKQGIQKSVLQLEKEKADFSYSPCRLLTADDKNHGFYSPRIGIFYWVMPFSHQTFMAKTSVLKEQGGFDLQYKIASDWDLIMKVILAGKKPCLVKHAYATFRQGGISSQQAQLVQTESRKVINANLSKYLKKEDNVSLSNGCLPKYVYKKIAQEVHPSIKNAMRFWELAYPKVLRKTTRPLAKKALDIWRSSYFVCQRFIDSFRTK